MTQKHTPGPWHIGAGNGEGSIYKTGEGRTRFDPQIGTALFPICSFNMGWSDGEDAANGRLLAAAPAMLAALHLALLALHMNRSAVDPVIRAEAKAAARAAIANAEGAQV